MPEKDNYIIERLGYIGSCIQANQQYIAKVNRRLTITKRAAGIGLILTGLLVIQASKRIDILEKEIKELKAEKEI